jgi:hypothetical protein
VVDGYVDVPDDLSQGDLGGLAMNGFTPAPVDAPAPAKAAKADQSPTGASPKTEPAAGGAATEA